MMRDLAAVAAELPARGAEVRLGDATTPVDADLVVTSPGWRPDQPLLVAAAQDGIEVIGEPELAWRLRPDGAADWLGVTGTNGKTTTVGMLASILTSAGLRTVAAGNVGLPLVDAVLAQPRVRRACGRAVELPAALVVDAAVLGREHPQRRRRPHRLARLVCRLRSGQVADPAWRCARDRQPRRRRLGRRRASAATRQVRLHRRRAEPWRVRRARRRSWSTPRESVLADVADLAAARARTTSPTRWRPSALARVRGVEPAAVRAGLRAFGPAGTATSSSPAAAAVDWVDDSKATNPHAAAASLSALRLGGVDRRRAAQGRLRRRAGRGRSRTGCARWC